MYCSGKDCSLFQFIFSKMSFLKKIFSKMSTKADQPSEIPQRRVEKEKKKESTQQTPREIDRASSRLMMLLRRSESNSYTSERPVHLDEDFVDSVSKLVNDSVSNLLPIIEPPSIYRVPEHIKHCIDHRAYKPTIVCIGPFNASTDSSSSKSRTIKALEPRVWSCYSEEIPISGNDLALMMMLDGCFILHLLLNQEDNIHEAFKDLEDSKVVFSKLSIWKMVKYDLLLLENQIPFFIVEKLFDLLRTPEDEHVNLVSLALKLFSNLQFHRTDIPFSIPTHQIHHLLHLFYISIVPYKLSVDQQPSLPSPTPGWISSATELQEAGVKFKKRRNALSFLDIKFSNGIMEIPPVEIHESSYRLFQNLIAFEQCYPDTQCHITAYASFMDRVINTPRDLRLLHLNGILTDRMGFDQGATNFFKQLCYLIHHGSDKNYLASVYEEVAKYQGSKWYSWIEGLAQDYCNNLWTVISEAVAAMLLLRTITQTFFALYPYFKPNN